MSVVNEGPIVKVSPLIFLNKNSTIRIMKKKIILIVYLMIGLQGLSYCQTLRDAIDGAKYAVDIFKLNRDGKKNVDTLTAKTTDACKDNFGQVCFLNNMLASVEIQIYVNEGQSDTISLIIPKTASECSYQLPVNIYEYCIINQKSKAILRKGQLKLERCDDLQVKIN